MITLSKLILNAMLISSNLYVLLMILFAYARKINILNTCQFLLITYMLVLMIQAGFHSPKPLQKDLMSWGFPLYELMMPIVMFGLILNSKKLHYLVYFVTLLACLLILDSKVYFFDAMSTSLLAIVLVCFYKNIERSFTDIQIYWICLMIGICLIPYNLSVVSETSKLAFFILIMVYPSSKLIVRFSQNYCSSLFSSNS